MAFVARPDGATYGDAHVAGAPSAARVLVESAMARREAGGLKVYVASCTCGWLAPKGTRDEALDAALTHGCVHRGRQA